MLTSEQITNPTNEQPDVINLSTHGEIFPLILGYRISEFQNSRQTNLRSMTNSH